MELVKTMLVDGQFKKRTVVKAPESVFTSRRALECFLSVYAGREWGDDFIIQSNPRGCLVPSYAVSTEFGDTLTVE